MLFLKLSNLTEADLVQQINSIVAFKTLKLDQDRLVSAILELGWECQLPPKRPNHGKDLYLTRSVIRKCRNVKSKATGKLLNRSTDICLELRNS